MPITSGLSVNIGEAVYAIGNPVALEGTFSEGIVSGVREVGSARLLQISDHVWTLDEIIALLRKG